MPLLRLLCEAVQLTRQGLHTAVSTKVVAVAQGAADLPGFPGYLAATDLGHRLKLIGYAFLFHSTSFAVARWVKSCRRKSNSLCPFPASQHLSPVVVACLAAVVLAGTVHSTKLWHKKDK